MNNRARGSTKQDVAKAKSLRKRKRRRRAECEFAPLHNPPFARNSPLISFSLVSLDGEEVWRKFYLCLPCIIELDPENKGVITYADVFGEVPVTGGWGDSKPIDYLRPNAPWAPVRVGDYIRVYWYGIIIVGLECARVTSVNLETSELWCLDDLGESFTFDVANQGYRAFEHSFVKVPGPRV